MTICPSPLPSPKPTSPIELFFNENYLDEFQDTEFKRKIINMVNEFNDLKEGMNYLDELKEKRNKFLVKVQENTNAAEWNGGDCISYCCVAMTKYHDQKAT